MRAPTDRWRVYRVVPIPLPRAKQQNRAHRVVFIELEFDPIPHEKAGAVDVAPGKPRLELRFPDRLIIAGVVPDYRAAVPNLEAPARQRNVLRGHDRIHNMALVGRQ